MPESIPYDPSLTLGSIVNQEVLNIVESISKEQGPVNAAQDLLNSLIASKRSLDMTMVELKNIGADAGPVEAELTKLKDAISKAAAAYATTKVAAEQKIQDFRKAIRTVHSSVESPIDYLKTEIKTMPLAADTLNMDVQYFNFDSNSQDSTAFSAQIASYVSETAGAVLPLHESSKMAAAASTQMSRQLASHKIEGTLVLSVVCTHKNANILAPFILHVDKAIKVWNSLFRDQKLDPTSQSSMMKVATSESQEDKKKFSIISGTTFGSSFVGMVHILDSTNTSVGDTLTAAATSLQSSMDSGAWFAGASGKSGVDTKFATDVKNLLSQQNVTSHVTLISMGVIPSMVANEVSRTVEKFTEFDPKSNMAQVAAIQNATVSDRSTIESMASSSRTGEQSADLQGKAIESSLSALSTIDGTNNKVLDINSMMTALEDYLKKASEGNCGVPINYYLKDIDEKMLAEMWAAKYFPGKFMAIKYDDSEGAGPATADGPVKAKL